MPGAVCLNEVSAFAFFRSDFFELFNSERPWTSSDLALRLYRSMRAAIRILSLWKNFSKNIDSTTKDYFQARRKPVAGFACSH